MRLPVVLLKERVSIVLRADGTGVTFNGKAGDLPTIKSYSHTPITYDFGALITPNRPTVLASPTSFVLSGELPDGLVFDSETGVITGTPNEIASDRILQLQPPTPTAIQNPLNFRLVLQICPSLF